MVKTFKFDNALVTIFGNFGELNSYTVTVAKVRKVIRGLFSIVVFDENGHNYKFKGNKNTRFVVNGFEYKELNNAYSELEKEMMNL